MNAATHGTEVNAFAPVLYMALELSNKIEQTTANPKPVAGDLTRGGPS